MGGKLDRNLREFLGRFDLTDNYYPSFKVDERKYWVKLLEEICELQLEVRIMNLGESLKEITCSDWKAVELTGLPPKLIRDWTDQGYVDYTKKRSDEERDPYQAKYYYHLGSLRKMELINQFLEQDDIELGDAAEKAEIARKEEKKLGCRTLFRLVKDIQEAIYDLDVILSEAGVVEEMEVEEINKVRELLIERILTAPMSLVTRDRR